MLLAFDVGQTRSRVRVRKAGSVLFAGETDGFRYGTSLEEQIIRVVGYVRAQLPDAELEVVAGGSTGLNGRVPALPDLGRRLAATAGVRRLYLADDVVTAHLGAFGGGPGVLAAVGTGLVAVALGPDALARVDGAGPLLGDNGAGWWIGREGIIAALSAWDGRSGGSADLLDRLQRHFGPAADVPRMIAESTEPFSTVASFAIEVAAAAREADPVARRIWRDAAHQIANAICAAAARAGAGPAFAWCLVGRIGRAADLLEPTMSSTVREAFPDARAVTAVGTALDGAERLPDAYATLRTSALVAEYHHE